MIIVKCIKRILSGLTALSLLLIISLPVFAVFELPEYKYDADLPLGIATDFHMFIRKDANINAHCFGNIAVGNLVSINSTFGQALVKDDDGKETVKNDFPNYIKNLSTGFSTAFYGNPFVFGKGAKVILTDNGNKNKVQMNGFSTTEMPPKDCKLFVEDESKPYIDLDKEFENLKNLSKEYANAKNSDNVQTKFEMNSAEIKTTADGVHVKNIKYKDTIALCNHASLNVLVSDTSKTTLIVNVDLAGTGDEVYVPVRVRFNGEANKERCDVENSKILWNFYDSSKADKVYNGTINFPNEWIGSIMAPGAKVNFSSNFDGTLIAESCSINGESHSWYYTGEKPEDVTPTKPTDPTDPTKPSVTPTKPSDPTDPTKPSVTPTKPSDPTDPIKPSVTPTKPSDPTDPTDPSVTPTKTPTKPTQTKPTETTKVTVKPTTVVTGENSTTTSATTAPEPLIVTNTVTTTPLVTVPENPTPQQIRRTLAYIDELLKKPDLTEEQKKELKSLRRTLALMLEMPNTGTEDRKATPVVLGGLLLAMGLYGFFNRRKLIEAGSKGK